MDTTLKGDILKIVKSIIGEIDLSYTDVLNDSIDIHNDILTIRYSSFNLDSSDTTLVSKCKKLIAYKVAFEVTGQSETTNSGAMFLENYFKLLDEQNV